MSNDCFFQQLSQKCMRCDGFLLAYQDVTSDPKFSGCVSHAECIQWEDRVDKQDTTFDQQDIRVESNLHTDDILVPQNNSTCVENNTTLTECHTVHAEGHTVHAEGHTPDMQLDITNDAAINNRMKS